jgi:hypothetical protein
VIRTTASRAVRLVPGGRELLDARRRVSTAVRRVVRPPRPPFGPPERVTKYSVTPRDEAFITGNGVAARCRYVLNFDVLAVNDHVDNDWWFCRSDYLEHFFRSVAPTTPFVLFSHNGDRTIGAEFRRHADRPELVAWFALNAAFAHPKLHALPIGIANPNWPHGDQATLARVQSEQGAKERLFDVSFDVATCPRERRDCLEQTGLALDARLPFPAYLERLAASYFCVSPRGNGIDCVRTWEALYVRTIPVVTRSLVADQHRNVPMVVLDDWSQFRDVDFGPELYARLWGDWSPDAIRLDRYLERVEATIAELRTLAP